MRSDTDNTSICKVLLKGSKSKHELLAPTRGKNRTFSRRGKMPLLMTITHLFTSFLLHFLNMTLWEKYDICT